MKTLKLRNIKSSIVNRQWSIELGFTLVELLAVIFVFVTVGSILLSILVAVLRGNSKTNAINGVRTNGDYAITQMAKAIRNSTTLLAPSPCGTILSPTATSAVKLAFPDGSITTYSCLDGSGSPSLTSNSASLINSTVNVVTCSFTCGQNSPSDYPIIGINFSLQTNTTSSFFEKQASASAVGFQTAVVIRNLIR